MQLRPNEFIEYELNEEELKSASVLSEMQTVFIRNQAAMTARLIMGLTVNTQDTQAYFLELAQLKGTLNAFMGLLNASEAMKEAIANDFADYKGKSQQFPREPSSS